MTIENFRSIRSLSCSLDEVTTFIGPNGAGKSTILRALDWFFNGEPSSIDQRDLHAAADGDSIRVKVEFRDLTDFDRAALGPRYGGPDATTFTAWKTWTSGYEKVTARALAFAPFETVREASGAMEKRNRYRLLGDSDPELGLPSASSASQVDFAMDEWERSHPDRLTDAEVSDTHFFGFNSRGKLSDLFDYVFVSADLRADAETADARESILGRILHHALNRNVIDDGVQDLTSRFETDYAALASTHLTPQLKEIAERITSEVSEYSSGRAVVLSATAPKLRPQLPRVNVEVSDGYVSTPVAHQGHGLQRTLLLSALSVLSRLSRAKSGSAQMFLAIEEPELFQHPTQARAFASVLRSLAGATERSVQVAYATHSPFFIEPLHFDQIRRVSSLRANGTKCASTRVTAASLEDIVNDLDGYLNPANIQRRWSHACLKYLPEALFAEAAILVEGDEDAAVLQGLGDRTDELAIQGITVAPVSGKSNMLLPFAILRRLGITALMVVDNDSGCGARMRANGRDEDSIAKAERDHVATNGSLCRFVGMPEESYPVGAVSKELAFVPDTLETLLASDLPGWDLTRKQLIREGRGVEGKDTATYELAAKECADEPKANLNELLALLRTARVA